MASIEPGVLPSMALAALPTAMPSSSTSFVPFFTATTLGSFRMMPRPRTHTSVLAVPRSMPMSTEKLPRTHSRGLRNEAMESDEGRRRRTGRPRWIRPGLGARGGRARAREMRLRSREGAVYSCKEPVQARALERAPRVRAGNGAGLHEQLVAVLRLHHVDQDDRGHEDHGGQDGEAGVYAHARGFLDDLYAGGAGLLRLGRGPCGRASG